MDGRLAIVLFRVCVEHTSKCFVKVVLFLNNRKQERQVNWYLLVFCAFDVNAVSRDARKGATKTCCGCETAVLSGRRSALNWSISIWKNDVSRECRDMDMGKRRKVVFSRRTRNKLMEKPLKYANPGKCATSSDGIGEF